jgi:acetyl esterase/lipase
MNTIRINIILLVLLITAPIISAEESITLWPDGKMPNSKGLKLEEIVANQRITQVDTPVMYAFFPSKDENKGSAVLICPSGGYNHLTYVMHGFQMAKWFNTMGVTAFVLKYRLPTSPDLIEPDKAPLQDAQRAIKIIRANAAKWDIKPDKIGVMGTSAGGHLASTLATHTENVSAVGDIMDKTSFRPDFLILISPVITMGQYAHTGSINNLLGDNPSKELIEKYSNQLQVTSQTPPAFIVHAVDDKTVNVRNSIMFFQALIDNNISASLHIFPQGQHEISLRNNPGSTALWTQLCEMWLKEMGLI